MRTIEDAERQLDDYLATGAAAMQVMDRKLQEARQMLIAAAISSNSNLVIHDGALQRVNMYEMEVWRDDANACLRIRVKPKTT
jgi:pyruvate/oxaloacetate carboxyltransferase